MIGLERYLKDIKEVKTPNSKSSAKQNDGSSSHPAGQPQTSQQSAHK